MVEPEGQTEYHREVAAGTVQQVEARLVLVRTVQTRSSEQQAGSLAEKAEQEVHRGWKRVPEQESIFTHRHRSRWHIGGCLASIFRMRMHADI